MVGYLASFQLDRNQIAEVSLVAECPGKYKGKENVRQRNASYALALCGQGQCCWQDILGIHVCVNSLPANLQTLSVICLPVLACDCSSVCLTRILLHSSCRILLVSSFSIRWSCRRATAGIQKGSKMFMSLSTVVCSGMSYVTQARPLRVLSDTGKSYWKILILLGLFPGKIGN